jgi:uncharacterized RDD family membrane protein YckC
MGWYYVERGEQKGPVTDADLATLAGSGKVGPETLVWQEGMPQWQPYHQAQVPASSTLTVPPSPQAGDVICTECLGFFPPDQVIKHGDVFICARCKPAFLQKLKEGIPVTGRLDYAGFWVRFGAKLVDGIILWIVNFTLGLAMASAMGKSNPMLAAMMNLTIGTLMGITYVTFFVGKFGATPGKMLAKLRIVNPDGTPVSYGKAFGRYFGELVSSFTLCIGYLMVAWDDQKRALHDRICNTRVIRVAQNNA